MKRRRQLNSLTVAALLFLTPLACVNQLHADGVIVDTIHFPGVQPVSLGVYEPGNTIFLTDDNSGNLLIIDGNTHQTVGAVQVGGAAFELTVNQSHGKVYVASRLDCCTTGITPGTGLISIVDATTRQLITRINLGLLGNLSDVVFARMKLTGESTCPCRAVIALSWGSSTLPRTSSR